MNRRINPTRLHTVDETAHILGTSHWTVRAMARRGELTKLPVGRRIYFSGQSILDLLEGNVRVPVPASIPETIVLTPVPPDPATTIQNVPPVWPEEVYIVCRKYPGFPAWLEDQGVRGTVTNWAKTDEARGKSVYSDSYLPYFIASSAYEVNILEIPNCPINRRDDGLTSAELFTYGARLACYSIQRKD